MALLMLAWPLLIWLGIELDLLFWLLPALIGLQLCHLWLTGRSGPLGRLPQLAAGVGITLCLASAILRQQQWLLYYPVVVNGLMLLVFGGSLRSTMPLVERLARLRQPDLPAAAIPYTRRVTRIWCGFFLFNGTVALFTCLVGNPRLWACWNGGIAYGLMGGLMAGEWLFRQRYLQREIS